MKEFLKPFYTDLTWKMTSLLMSVALWVLIRMAVVEQDEASRSDGGLLASRQIQKVPIIVQTSATDTNKYLIQPQTVRVTIEGQSTLLETVDASRIQVVADMTRRSGENAFAVALDVTVPPEFKYKHCEPKSIRVERVD